MTPASDSIVGTSVVLVGRFNPAIIHPAWFAHHEVLPPSDLAEDPDLKVVSPSLALFQIGWLTVQVTDDHFELSTMESDRVVLMRDAAINIFALLSHTPLNAIGLNRPPHYPLGDGQLQRIREVVPPSPPWTLFETPSELSSLTVQGARADFAHPGYIRLTIEPSVRIVNGIFISINDHFELDVDELEPHERTGKAMEILDQSWKDSIARHDSFTEFVLQKARA